MKKLHLEIIVWGLRVASVCVCAHVTVLPLILGFFCVACMCMFTITLRANTHLSKSNVMFLEVLLKSDYKDIFLYLC